MSPLGFHDKNILSFKAFDKAGIPFDIPDLMPSFLTSILETARGRIRSALARFHRLIFTRWGDMERPETCSMSQLHDNIFQSWWNPLWTPIWPLWLMSKIWYSLALKTF